MVDPFTVKAAEFAISDLVFLSFDDREINESGKELNEQGELANTIQSDAGVDLAAPDYDGGEHKWTVLALRADLERWQSAAKQYGVRVEASEPDANEHYGDGNWSGVDLVAVPRSDTRVYWIER